jgi:hypothetical protein
LKIVSRRLIWLAGFALIALGILFLCVSDDVVGPGWWQGTWQALGVGFIVGGVVDVAAISLLNHALGDTSWGQQDLNSQALLLVRSLEFLGHWRGSTDIGDDEHLARWYEGIPLLHEYEDSAEQFLRMHGDETDPLLRKRIQRLLDRRQSSAD